jgi:hypothetical protein
LLFDNHKRLKEPIEESISRSIVRCKLRAVTCIFYQRTSSQGHNWYSLCP